MKGYLNSELLSKQVLQNEWFRTGDLGRFTKKKEHLQIAGRITDIVTLKNGKQVNPAFVEGQILNSTFFEQCIILGEDMPYLSALIVPSFINLKLWGFQKKLSFHSMEELLSFPDTKNLFQQQIIKINKNLSEREQIAQYRILDQPWTKENGELNHLFKIKRKFILQKYNSIIEELLEYS